MTEIGRKFELNQLEKQANATKEAAEKIEALEQRLESLENTIKTAADSSGKVAKALNFLTGALVLVGIVSAVLQYVTNS